MALVDDLEAVERWFVGRGIPHFIADYSASRDVLTRAVPILSLVFVVELVGALNRDWPWWANVLAAAGGLGIMVGGLAVSNSVRDRPLLARPDSVGLPDLSVFVLVPALLPLVFGGRIGGALLTAGGNLVLVGLIYVVTSYGLLPMTTWGLGRLLRQIGDLAGLLVRALPLLLLFVTFLFINAEVWQVSANLTGGFFWATIGLFFAIGTVFIVTRLPREVGRLATFDHDDAVFRLARGTPATDLGRPEGVRATPGLSRREWGNIGLVLLFSQGLQILLVTVIIGIFFVAFGLLVMEPSVIATWTTQAPHELASLDLWGRAVPVTEELLRVAGFLAAFSGLYFTVVAMTDATYREEFYEDVVAEVREALAVRAVYLAAFRSAASSSPE